MINSSNILLHRMNSARRRLFAASAVGARPLIEPLEDRRLLSVSLSSIIGATATGTVREYELTGNNDTVVHETETVIGHTTFNGHNVIERDIVITNDAGNTSTDKEYEAVTSDGLVDYGSETTITNAQSVVTQHSRDTYSPGLVGFPATFTAGVEHSATATDTFTDLLAQPNTTEDSTETDSVTLVSETRQSITVGAGTFNCYELTETENTIDANGDESPSTITIFAAPTVGIVKIISGEGDNTVTEELASFNGEGDGGGDNNGGDPDAGTAVLTPTVTKDSLPPAAVSGVPVKGGVTVTVTNTGDGTSSGATTVELFATTTGEIDNESTSLGTVSKPNLVIKPTKTAKFNFSIKNLDLPAGEYTIIARTTDADANELTATADQTLVVAAPFVDLSATFVVSSPKNQQVLPGKTAKFKLDVTNNGNIAAVGLVDATFSSSPNADGSAATDIGTLSESVKIAAGKHKVFTISYKVPVGSVPGTYYYVADVDPSNTLNDTDRSDNTPVTPTPLTTLDPYLDILGTLSGALTIKKGPDKGSVITEQTTVDTEDNTSGAITLTTVSTSPLGVQSTDTATGTITTKGVVNAVYTSGVSIKGKVSKGVFKGKYLDPNTGDSGTFTITLDILN